MTRQDSLERHRAAVRTRLLASGAARATETSISWTLNREIILVAGWGRAILLQLAHPLVAAGVREHSGFSRGMISSVARLRSTVGAMLALTFGTDDEAIDVAARINTIHDRVRGHLAEPAGRFAAGHRYSAHDADLLRWVHATLLESIPLVYERLVAPLTDDDRDRYYAEASIMEPLLDIPAGSLPRNTRDLGTYMQSVLAGGTLTVTEGTRRIARAVLYPRGWQLLWPAFRPLQLITIGLLPPGIRQAYGFTWTDRDTRALRRWTTAIRMLRRAVPAVLREWPAARRRSANPIARRAIRWSGWFPRVERTTACSAGSPDIAASSR
jgi:uncharacterized protein (DUF2236 family)